MKQVHWQLPFASLNGTQYRIDIYAEGAPVGGVKTLTGGATPFTTDEDNNDDFFAPVRSQTGILNIVKDSIDFVRELVPNDNVSRPVRVISMPDDDIVWQGFLSCETYTQDYTDRPSEISIPVNSVLAAMKSVYLYPEDVEGLMRIKYIFTSINNRIEEYCGWKPKLCVPEDSREILMQYVNTCIFFSTEDYIGEDYAMITAKSDSIADIIGEICKFMGWVARENGDMIVLFKPDYNGRYFVYDTDYFMLDGLQHLYTIYTENISIDDMEWRGVEHSISINQGKRLSIVESELSSEEQTIEQPDILRCNTLFDATYASGNKVYHAANNKTNNLITCRAYEATTTFQNGWPTWALSNGLSAHELIDRTRMGYAYNTGSVNPKNSEWARRKTNNQHHVLEYSGAGEFNSIGATVCSIQQEEFENKTYDCILLYLAPKFYTPTDETEKQNFLHTDLPPVYEQTWPIKVFHDISMRHGYIKIEFEAKSTPWRNYEPEELDIRLCFAFLIGNKSYSDTMRYNRHWEIDDIDNPTRRFIARPYIKHDDGEGHITYEKHTITLPVDADLDGEMKLIIYPQMNDDGGAIMIQGLSVVYENEYHKLGIDTDVNRYIINTKSLFQDDITISSKLATDKHNTFSYNTLRLNYPDGSLGEFPLTLLKYYKNNLEVGIRPEYNLVKRVAEHYKKNRSIVSLVVDTNYYGVKKVIGYNREEYAPLAISTDWRMGTSTVKCFEYTPEDDSEYTEEYRDPTLTFPGDPDERDWGYDYDNGDGRDQDGPDPDGPDFGD